MISNMAAEPDAYYGEPDINTDEIDLSFLED